MKNISMLSIMYFVLYYLFGNYGIDLSILFHGFMNGFTKKHIGSLFIAMTYSFFGLFGSMWFGLCLAMYEFLKNYEFFVDMYNSFIVMTDDIRCNYNSYSDDDSNSKSNADKLLYVRTKIDYVKNIYFKSMNKYNNAVLMSSKYLQSDKLYIVRKTGTYILLFLDRCVNLCIMVFNKINGKYKLFDVNGYCHNKWNEIKKVYDDHINLNSNKQLDPYVMTEGEEFIKFMQHMTNKNLNNIDNAKINNLQKMGAMNFEQFDKLFMGELPKIKNIQKNK